MSVVNFTRFCLSRNSPRLHYIQYYMVFWDWNVRINMPLQRHSRKKKYWNSIPWLSFFVHIDTPSNTTYYIVICILWCIQFFSCCLSFKLISFKIPELPEKYFIFLQKKDRSIYFPIFIFPSCQKYKCRLFVRLVTCPEK